MHYFYESIINNEQKEQKSTCEENYLRQISLGSLRMTKNKIRRRFSRKREQWRRQERDKDAQRVSKWEEKHRLLVQVIQGQGLQK